MPRFHLLFTGAHEVGYGVCVGPCLRVNDRGEHSGVAGHSIISAHPVQASLRDMAYPLAFGLTPTALLVLEISVAAVAGAVYSDRSCRAVHEERRVASGGRDLHSWIERTKVCMNGTRIDIKALTAGGV